MPDSIDVQLAELRQSLEFSSQKTNSELNRLSKNVNDLTHMIRGNGQPGMVRTIENIQTRVEMIEDDKVNQVTANEFRPVRLIVFGGVGIVLTAVATAIVALVLKSQI